MVKGKVFGIVLAIMLAIVLCGCGVKEKPEKEVVADLQASRWFISENLEIKSYKIKKRQTDVENKKDIVYLTVHTNEPEMTCDLSYVMEYVLYNDGWVLEAVRKDEEGEWSIQGVSQERLIKDIVEKDDFYDTWDLNIKSCSIENEVYIYNDGEYEKQHMVVVKAEREEFCHEATYMLSYRITENGWENGEFFVDSRDYWPIVSADESAPEKVVKGLTMKYGYTTINYDGYKYLDTVTDWRNRSETHRYLAWKDWFYGRETYLISVPFGFSLKDDMPTWTDKTSEIDIKLHSVEWNIAGTWRNKYEPGFVNSYTTAILKINNITGTEDPEVYYASVACNAKNERWEGEPRCQTNGTVKATIKYSEQGQWFLYIDHSDGDWDSFVIRGYEAGYNYQGFFWHYNRYSGTGCELKKESR